VLVLQFASNVGAVKPDAPGIIDEVIEVERNALGRPPLRIPVVRTTTSAARLDASKR
jgi:hypothetical protein